MCDRINMVPSEDDYFNTFLFIEIKPILHDMCIDEGKPQSFQSKDNDQCGNRLIVAC